MSRSINEIQQSILTSVQADENLSELSSKSSTAIWRLWTYIVAVCAWSLEKLFDTFKADVLETISRMKPGSVRWYAEMAKAFQYGCQLPPDTDQYDNSHLTDDQVQASKIVKYSSVVEQAKNLRVKVAKETTDLEPLTSTELAAFREYMQRITYAGVRLQIESRQADTIKAKLIIYYDPLVLNDQGQRLDDSDSEPVQTAFKNYLKQLPFNGLFVTTYLIDALQKVEGIVIPQLVSCSAKYGDIETAIDVMYVPDAGYLRLENETDLELEFIPQSVIQ
ncbi:hypothetical protein [Pinibacter soli]|uniref:Nucleotidyltransferase n=1 Tax=Pinibacter soli TaxID=3044211 RepID=A0ABT6R975_9BACT|nr:hypothetical protein [Pinibacter soli]MDI3319119.1 hypothetical protein [Pinibacter soli]